MPEWYPYTLAAKYYGCYPGLFIDDPDGFFWRDAATIAESAEKFAESERQKRIDNVNKWLSR